MTDPKISAVIDASMLDEVIEKANQLIGLLQEAQQIIDSLYHGFDLNDQHQSPTLLNLHQVSMKRQRVSCYGVQYRGKSIYVPEILMHHGKFVEIQDGIVYYDGKEIYRI